MKYRQSPSGIICSFCGQDQEAGRRMVSGPDVYICNECVRLCNEILSDEPPLQGEASTTSRSCARRGGGWWRRLLPGEHSVIHTAAASR
ncbi:MAG: hypothetical protein IVW55_03585 [Chloroflexi bacterium]|nr:hypothetical protein [Chloroflexota bacterium]